LKNRFGRGYYLTIAKKPIVGDGVDAEDSKSIASGGGGSGSSEGGSSSTDSGLPDYNSVVNLEGVEITESGDGRSAGGTSLDEVEAAQRQKEKLAVESLSSKQDLCLYEFVMKHVANARLVENIGLEMTFTISNQGEFTKSYEKFFRELEANVNSLGIDSIGISDTTLEEIFIKLAAEPQSNHFKGARKICGVKMPELACFKEKPAKELNETEMARYAALTKVRVESKFVAVFKQLTALLLKRFHRVKRNWKGFFAEIILPVVFVCLALLVATLVPKLTNAPSLELHPWYYQMPNQVFLSRSSSLGYEVPTYGFDGSIASKVDPKQQANIDEVDRIVNTFYKSSSLGTRCMDGYR